MTIFNRVLNVALLSTVVALGFSVPVHRAFAQTVAATKISAGPNSSIAIDSNQGVWTWGYQGLVTYTGGGSSDVDRPVPIRGLSAITEVAGTNGSFFARTNSGGVYAWGSNNFGQLGNGNNTDTSTPVLIGISGVTDVESGNQSAFALKNDGTVWAWGDNAYGTLGNGSNVSSNIPVQVSGLSNVISVKGGALHGIAHDSGGSVKQWGFGVGNTPVAVSGLPANISEIAAGGTNDLTHGLALTSDGNVWAWIGTNAATQISGLSSITAITAGNGTGFALKNDGTVWSWGKNNAGQLGDGTNNNSATPVQVSGLQNVTAISSGSGGGHTLARKSDGTVWAWGFNAFGQLGNVSASNSNVPVEVKFPFFDITPPSVSFFSPAPGAYAYPDSVIPVSVSVTEDLSIPVSVSLSVSCGSVDGPFQVFPVAGSSQAFFTWDTVGCALGAASLTAVATNSNPSSASNSSTATNPVNIVALKPLNLVQDTNFPVVNGMVTSLVKIGNVLYIGGQFTLITPQVGPNAGVPQSRNNVAAVDTTTGDVTPWNPGASSRVDVVTTDGSGVYIGGTFTSVGGQSRNRLAAVDASGNVLSWNPNVNNVVNALAIDGTTMYASGSFTNVGGQPRNRLAAIDVPTGAVLAWNPNANSVVSTLVLSGANIYVGGAFTNIGGQPRNRLAAIDVPTGTVLAWNPGANSTVNTLATDGAAVYAGGSFTNVGGQPRNRLAAIDVSTGAVLAWNPGASPFGTVNTLGVAGTNVFVGGSFSALASVSRLNSGAVGDDGILTTWNPGANGPVRKFLPDNGTLYVGGAFTAIDGTSHAGLAKFTASDAPPVITFTETPENPTGMPYARFQFTASDDVTPTADLWFECRLDGGGFSFCHSPHVISSGLGIGNHTFEVRTQDAEGNISVASFTWTVQVMPTKLRAEDCGASTNTLATFLYVDPVVSATNYQWEFSHPASGFLKTIQRGFGLNNFHLTWVPGIQYGKTYDVRIKTFAGGVWQEYGPTCQFTVSGPIPSPKLRDADSGLTTSSLNQLLFTDAVAGAQNYQWEFTHAASAFQKAISRGNTSLNFILGWIQGITYGKTYDIRIKASVGGVWGDFGSARQVTLAYPIPTTKVRYADCGRTLSSLSQNIFADLAPGATNYEWEFTNTDLGYSTTFLRNSTSVNVQFGWLAGIQYGTTYDVRVRGKAAGEWAEYGFVCQVTTPASPGINDTDVDGIDNAVDTQPSTFSDDFSDVSLGGTTSGTITTRGGRTWYVYDQGAPKGVAVAVSSAGTAATVVGTGVCQPQTSNTIPANTAAGFVLTCGSVETEVYDGEVISSATSGGAFASVSITPRNSVRFSSPQAGTIVVQLDTDELNGLMLTANDGTHELLPGGSIAVRESGVLSLPVVTPAVSGVQGAGGWYLSDVAVDFRVSADTEFTTQGCESGTVTADTSGTAFPCIATSAEGATDGTITIKRDTVAPSTTLTESSEGSAPWFRSSTITLSGTDATSGIARIEYRLDGSGWKVYDAPIVLKDGEHTVAYRSVDNAGNVGAERSITRSVDGTPPELSAQCVLSEEALAVAGSDSGSGLSSATLTNTERVKEGKFKERRTYTITDIAGNILEALFGIKAEGHESAFSLLTLSYNGTPASLPSNDMKCEWSEKAGAVHELEQKLSIKSASDATDMTAKFRSKDNSTTIQIKTPGGQQRTNLPNLVFLRLESNAGTIEGSY